MENYKFTITDDGSIGLYDKRVGDIFHSKSGALKEAEDKFLYPLINSNVLSGKEYVNVLDICYGVGYNSKCLLSRLNDKYKINIDAAEADINLINLSPVINDLIKDDDLKIFILYCVLCLNNSSEFINKIDDYISKNHLYFSASMRRFIRFLCENEYNFIPDDINLPFLHNIYYDYISNNKNCQRKSNKYTNCHLSFLPGDARCTLKQLDKFYDVIFLDAFSPQKDPALWTIDFLSLLKSKMNKNSILISYSKSTPFRSALLKLGFYVGKTILDNNDMGTLASLNQNYIIYPLSDFDISLINTRAGIPYKDSSLSLSSKQILTNRTLESSSSDLISHTQFLKLFK